MEKRSRWSSFAWYWQRISGVLLVVLAIGHYLTVHWTESSGHAFDSSVARLQNPIYVTLYLAFVVLGLWHGAQGTWNVIRDFKLPKPLYNVAVVALLGLTFYFIYVGFHTVLTIGTWSQLP